MSTSLPPASRRLARIGTLLSTAAVALGASLALAGCALIPMGPGAPGPDLGGDSAGTDSTDSGATGDADGSFSAGAGVDLPEGWPSEVPVPDGTIVTASHADDVRATDLSYQTCGVPRSPGAPFGGMKQSGNGREGGTWDSTLSSAASGRLVPGPSMRSINSLAAGFTG